MAYNPTDHPRAPKGTPQGGQFTQKAGVGIDDDLAGDTLSSATGEVSNHAIVAIAARHFDDVQERVRQRVNQVCKTTGQSPWEFTAPPIDEEGYFTDDAGDDPAFRICVEESDRAAQAAVEEIFAPTIPDGCRVFAKYEPDDLANLDARDVYYTNNFNSIRDRHAGVNITMRGQLDGDSINFCMNADGKVVGVTCSNAWEDTVALDCDVTIADIVKRSPELFRKMNQSMRGYQYIEEIFNANSSTVIKKAGDSFFGFTIMISQFA